MLKSTVYNYWRDANNYQHTCFYKIIHFSVQFSAIVNRFIVKHNLILLLQVIEKQNLKKNRKMFIVADYASLTVNMGRWLRRRCLKTLLFFSSDGHFV